MSDETVEKVPAKRGQKANPLTISQVIMELKAGKTAQQIAALYGYKKDAIWKILKRHGFSIKALRAYKEHRADLFAFKQQQIVEAMTPEKIQAASLRDQATTLNILHNAERLERGQSTDNVSFAAVTREIGELDAEEARLRNLLLSSEKGGAGD